MPTWLTLYVTHACLYVANKYIFRRLSRQNSGSQAVTVNRQQSQVGSDTGRVMFNSKLGVPYITANIYCKSRNLPNTDLRIYSIDLR